MNSLKCQRCRADVPVPDLSADARKDVAGIADRVGRMQAILDLRNGAGLSLDDAKAIVSHISGAGGVCHRCGARLTEGEEEQNCPKCRSLNLVW